ncbi:MAG: tyrosine-type recombinase/integrase [Akkermansia sp.]|nr:tyrosine-type recombinase/integrase [Akkermansia sp.]
MNTQGEEEAVALTILRRTGVNIVEAALVAKAALEAGKGRVKRAIKCVQMGAAELKRQEKTVTFAKAVEAALETRKERRPRTQSDFRYITRRFMKHCKGLAQRRVRSIRSEECAKYIERAFHTPSQQAKARRILSGVFSTALKRGWCSENPVAMVEAPKVQENCIEILQPQQITAILQQARQYENGRCLAAVGLMLYAGIRPHEVARLSWADVDIAGRSICISAKHSKTGGARLVSIQPPLLRLLKECPATGRICPSQWLRHWRALRKQAGFTQWQPDVLRHTFASYHLRHFKDYAALQYETGHRDSTLLRTRYVNMRGVVNATQFWT